LVLFGDYGGRVISLHNFIIEEERIMVGTITQEIDNEGYTLVKYPYGTLIANVVSNLILRTCMDKKLYKAVVNGIELKSDTVSLDYYFVQKHGVSYIEALADSISDHPTILMEIDIPEELKPTDKDKRLMAQGHLTIKKKFWLDYDQFVIEATRGKYRGYEIPEILSIISLINSIAPMEQAVKRFIASSIMDDDEYKQYKLKAILSFISEEKGEEFKSILSEKQKDNGAG
jgi:hypothetical protein